VAITTILELLVAQKLNMHIHFNLLLALIPLVFFRPAVEVLPSLIDDWEPSMVGGFSAATDSTTEL
jgi:hypothetical protein